LRYRDQTLHERREQFELLLREAGDRFARESIRTLIVIDGLDHVPREERPQRSFLAELPLPSSVPIGVLFILGTQRVNLDDIKPAIQDQASETARSINVTPLGREAVHRMADLMRLSTNIDRDSIFEMSRGHPLVTHYLIEALREADSDASDALLAGEMTFDGNVESIYESAWRGIRNDAEARNVLDYLARSEAPMPLELLIHAVSEAAVERALNATRHLLNEGLHGWGVFHNSFRLFIIDKPRARLGKADPDYGKHVYRKLAELARAAPNDAPQRWLELRYLARAEEHAAVLALATPARFRQQLADRRSYPELRADLRLAFTSAKYSYDPLKVFQLLLIQDEIDRRWSACEEAPAIVQALLHVGDLDGAVAFVEQAPAQGYEVVDALLKAGEFSRARALFDQLEPLQQLLNGASHGNPVEVYELHDWAQRVIHFRDSEQICLAIRKLSKAARHSSIGTGQEDNDELALELHTAVAMAFVSVQDNINVYEVGQRFDVDAASLVHLKVKAGLVAADRGNVDSALRHFEDAEREINFDRVANSWRRNAAVFAAVHGDVKLAERIFENLRFPPLADLEHFTDQDAPEKMVRAILEYSMLAAMIGKQVSATFTSDHHALRALKFHAEAIGSVLGRARIEPSSVHPGEVSRVARAALTYLDCFLVGNSELHALHHLLLAMPVLGKSLVQASVLCGEQEFKATLSEFERAFGEANGTNHAYMDLRREVAVEIFRCTGNTVEASRCLKPMVEALLENTPEEQINGLAKLAIAFAQIENVSGAKAILCRIPNESLGYALAPSKDPQYKMWREILQRANEIDPHGRLSRVNLLLRQVNGMMMTEGYAAACRLAAPLLKEAATYDSQTGWKTGKKLVERSAIGWAQMVDALLLVLLRRRPDLILTATISWCELALPYFKEHDFAASDLGEFIEVAITNAPSTTVHTVANVLLNAIEAESRAHERAALLNKLLEAATARGVCTRAMKDARVRWMTESPPPRRWYTPSRYDNIQSLHELKTKLEEDASTGKVGYEVARAFSRLAPDSELDLAITIFERWDSIQGDSRARSTVVNLAIDSGRIDIACSLLEDYEIRNNDRATWTERNGGISLRYFKDKLRLQGSHVHKEAYDNFVASLAAGRESIMYVLLEYDEIFSTLTDVPDWAGMWDLLAEQLATTREFRLGEVVDAFDESSLSDEDLIASLFAWALSLPLDELRRHAFCGALRLYTCIGKQVFVALVRRLLVGRDDEPADGVMLLLLDTSDRAAPELSREVLELANHADFAVAEPSSILARRWGLVLCTEVEALPSFYSLILETDDTFVRPHLVDSATGSMVVEDPTGWTYAFEDQIKMLANVGVSISSIRLRCSMFINQWGGLEAFGSAATNRLQAKLRQLDLKMPHARPHMAAAARAFRHVAGELRRAGMIPEEAKPILLHMMGYPSPRPKLIIPETRPAFIRRPVLDDANLRTQEEDWLNGDESDLLPLIVTNDYVVAEVSEFHFRKSCRKFHYRRVRAPGLELGENVQDFQGFELLPGATWIGRIFANSQSPASSLVRSLMVSGIPEVPRYHLTICPHWLLMLGWHPHPSNELLFMDKSNAPVARIIWWRDGGPVDVDDDVIWGEGAYISLTMAGQQQVEIMMGPLNVRVHVRRSYETESNQGVEKSRLVSSREN
jgi:tetratricopeptide (TPR) repeat protein